MWRLRRISLEEKISNFGGHPFGMVIMEIFSQSSSFLIVVVWGRWLIQKWTWGGQGGCVCGLS